MCLCSGDGGNEFEDESLVRLRVGSVTPTCRSRAKGCVSVGEGENFGPASPPGHCSPPVSFAVSGWLSRPNDREAGRFAPVPHESSYWWAGAWCRPIGGHTQGLVPKEARPGARNLRG